MSEDQYFFEAFRPLTSRMEQVAMQIATETGCAFGVTHKTGILRRAVTFFVRGQDASRQAFKRRWNNYIWQLEMLGADTHA